MDVSSVSSASSRESRKAPVPLPRTKFLDDPGEMKSENSGGLEVNNHKKEKKGNYAKIKDLFPKSKAKNKENKPIKPEKYSIYERKSIDVPPRPKHSKPRQNKSNRSQELRNREVIRAQLENQLKDIKQRKLDSKINDSNSDPANGATSSQLTTKDPGVEPSCDKYTVSTNLVDLEPKNLPTRSSSANLVPHVTSSSKITTKEQFVEVSQKAMECIQGARTAYSDGLYNKTALKYQESLELIEMVLETPLASLNLSPIEEDKAAHTLLDMKLLRKDALQGFSDAQYAYTPPQGLLDLPSGAPPSYTDVLNEDLLHNTSEMTRGATPLLPYIPSRTSLSHSPTTDLVQAESGAITRNLKRNSVPAEGIAAVHSSSHNRNSQVIQQATNPASGSTSVRPKLKPKPLMMYNNYTRSRFPPDVPVSKKPGKENIGQQSDISLLSDGDKTSQAAISPSRGRFDKSSESEASFVTALSSPITTPLKNNVQNIMDKQSLNNNILIHNPFAFEDPFSTKLSHKNDQDNSIRFSKIELHSTPSKGNSKLTHEISFLKQNSYHTEIIGNNLNNPFLSLAMDDNFPVVDGNNPFNYESNVKTVDKTKTAVEDPFNALQEEARQYFMTNKKITQQTENQETKEQERESSPFHREVDSSSSKSKNTSSHTSFSVDDSLLDNQKTRGVKPTDANYASDNLTRKSRLSKSVINLNERKQFSSKHGKKLNRMKTMSRSNESILLMFDPIISEEVNSSYEIDSSNLLHDFIQSNPLYDIPFKELKIDDQNEQLLRKSNETEHCPPPIPDRKTSCPFDVVTESKSQKPQSLYPKLTDVNNRPLPPVPERNWRKISNNDSPPSRQTPQESTIPTNKLEKNNLDKIDTQTSNSPYSIKSDEISSHKKKQKNKKRSSKQKEKYISSDEELYSEEDNELAVGRSAFYKPSVVRPHRSRKNRSPNIQILPVEGSRRTADIHKDSTNSPAKKDDKIEISSEPKTATIISIDSGNGASEVAKRENKNATIDQTHVSPSDELPSTSCEVAKKDNLRARGDNEADKTTVESSKKRGEATADASDANIVNGKAKSGGNARRKCSRGMPPVGHSNAVPWQEILHLTEAVKLFFLSDAVVSSPFNRQSLLLLRKGLGHTSGDDAARLEVGGELFAKDLSGSDTLIMLDHHGDYIMQSSPDVYVCLALCSKVKRSHVISFEKAMQIYANFAKEVQLVKLPGGMEAAAANVKKVVKEKAPSVAKTTSFVKRNSLKALGKLKKAMVGDEDSETKEPGPEFMPLQKACLQFREARQLKTVRYF